jgi:hypothetical protein
VKFAETADITLNSLFADECCSEYGYYGVNYDKHRMLVLVLGLFLDVPPKHRALSEIFHSFINGSTALFGPW